MPDVACSSSQGRIKINDLPKGLSCELEYPDLCHRSRLKIGVKKKKKKVIQPIEIRTNAVRWLTSKEQVNILDILNRSSIVTICFLS